MPQQQPLDDLQAERVQELLKQADLPLLDDPEADDEEEVFDFSAGLRPYTASEALNPEGCYGWRMVLVQLLILLFVALNLGRSANVDMQDCLLSCGYVVIYSVICSGLLAMVYCIRFLVVVVYLRPMVRPKICIILDVFDPYVTDVMWTCIVLILPSSLFSDKTPMKGVPFFLLPLVLEAVYTTNLLLVLWASKNLCRSLLVFHFRLRFSMNRNRELVRYLSLYSSLRKLNLLWKTLILDVQGSALDPMFTDIAQPEVVIPEDSRRFRPTNRTFATRCRGKRTPSSVSFDTVSDLPTNEIYSEWLRYSNIKATERSRLKNLLSLTRVQSDCFSLYPHGMKTTVTRSRHVNSLARQMLADFNDIENRILDTHNLVTPASPTTRPNTAAMTEKKAVRDFKKALSRVEAQKTYSDEQSKARGRVGSSPMRTRGPSGGVVPAVLRAVDFLPPPEGPSSSRSSSSDSMTSRSSSGSPSRPASSHSSMRRGSSIRDQEDVMRPSRTFTQDPEHQVTYRPRRRLLYAAGRGIKSPSRSCTEQKLLDKALNNLVQVEEVKQQKIEEDHTKISRRTLECFLRANESKVFFDLVDPSNRGEVGYVAMRRCLRECVKMWQTLSKSRDSTRSTLLVFSNMVDVLLMAAFGLVFFYSLGVAVEWLVVSGAAVISSMAVSLSVLYSSYLQAVALICFINPYGIGDRLYIDGKLNVVREMTTFYTVCNDIQDKIVIWPHHILLNKVIMNGTRSHWSTFEITFDIGYNTHVAKMEALNRMVVAFIKARPSEWVFSEFFYMLDDVQPDHFQRVLIYATYNESWHYWMKVFTAKSDLLKHIIKCTRMLEITYSLPDQPLSMKALMRDAMNMKTN
ncbi:MAG: hypothetical protein KVP17_004702 [Porospora cf. gigantea B]|uniref:uncharacterized protein n=1 Tax=Porospora cf. gigantea B TaxID=2853592 RepID=UPI003571E635|nr:MAG: hypothetical protein KVP17_004702 [Porospora cf. gigantea B]